MKNFKSFVQMLPLIKKSIDNLVDIIGEKATSEKSFVMATS